ncbi:MULTISPECIES: phosphatidate cytidylyltransferase [Halobacteriovorax]|uniref:Phosphatidate cytidylyltransferase n=1 Tax=Halobacteriovorax vibrionivorans TaxID=2152716 RepID=A0ABY0IJZ7_9BACT|nr:MULTISPECIES: phosphatidate cytidylyltransferase [Halobacteriovorax]AYF43268.1 phosphatidate cytidylyltransferase [Halobacteriovorax sp. BALOs_7]RZF22156.1 hypothetical protein DAY19_10770 [Halobacteriovorax vibrionivorans]TGD47144.1 hypothetical protein EP118_09045 [Halobacteriovorax sp. Y22]
MTNTQKRILSAIVMIGIVAIAYSIGVIGIEVLLILVSAACLFEFSVNFLSLKIGSLFSILNFFILIGVQSWATLNPQIFGNQLIPLAGCLVNILLMGYLFISPMDSMRFVKFLKSISIMSMVIFLIPFLNLHSLLHRENWQGLIIILLIFNFGMDTGAWFFGKNFGRTKLWKAVSPNKTIEGLIGGALTSGILGTLAWYYLIGNFEVKYILIFFILGILSQVGDLVQSKFKRQIGVKDSSNLIPGHGGVYDRIDSLLFVIPFYTLLLSDKIL